MIDLGSKSKGKMLPAKISMKTRMVNIRPQVFSGTQKAVDMANLVIMKNISEEMMIKIIPNDSWMGEWDKKI